MPLAAERKGFRESENGIILRDELLGMIASGKYNTGTSAGLENDFVDKHVRYVSRFSYIDPRQYVMNLKMKSRR